MKTFVRMEIFKTKVTLILILRLPIILKQKTNLNSEKISKISDNDLKIINTVFKKTKGSFGLFNYKIIER